MSVFAPLVVLTAIFVGLISTILLRTGMDFAEAKLILIAGAAIGIAIAWLLTRDAMRARFAPQALEAIRRFPAPAYTLAFLLCFELITQFDELLTLAQSVKHTTM